MPHKDPKKRAEYSKKYYEANKEKRDEHDKKYYEANKEKIAARKKKHYEANKAQITECNKKYREANKVEQAEYHKKYKKANPEIVARNRLTRRNKLKISVTQSPEDNLIVKQIYLLRDRINKCVGIPRLMHVDHIIPVSRGGSHTPGNLQILPAKLNRKKGAKLINISTNFQNENTNTDNPG